MFAAGCANDVAYQMPYRPAPKWPDPVYRPQPTMARQPVAAPTRPAMTRTTPPPAARNAEPVIMKRGAWTSAAPIQTRLNPMNGINRITIHHEGWTPVSFEDQQTTATRLEMIRRSHLDRMTAGDIGYHFVVDRAGRVWQGRSLTYQGAHVKDSNPHNMGIMVLGNFDLQSPSNEQIRSLQATLNWACGRYSIRSNQIFTHQELAPTACPGTALQRTMVSLRQSGHVG